MNWIIFTSLLAVWVDVFASTATGVIFGPVVAWAGMIFYIQKNRTFELVLWILLLGAWSLFVAPPQAITLQTIVYLVASAGMYILFRRFIPEDSKWLRALMATVVSLISLSLTVLVVARYFGAQLIFPATIIILVSVICVQYVQKNEK